MPGPARHFACAEDLLAIESVSRESLSALETYVETLLHWNRRINLIGPDTVDAVWHRHIADSLQLLTHLPGTARSVVDIGSGAGLPGLPLALAFRPRGQCMFHLVESNARKAAFLRESARQTQAPVTVHNTRIESLDSAALQGKPDVVVSRALAPLAKLLEYAQKPLENGAFALFLKGRYVERELTETRKYWIIDIERIDSLTEPEACILKINEARRVA